MKVFSIGRSFGQRGCCLNWVFSLGEGPRFDPFSISGLWRDGGDIKVATKAVSLIFCLLFFSSCFSCFACVFVL